MKSIDLILFADYYQFYLQDDDERYGDLSAAWTEEAVQRLMALGDHVVGIGTVSNMDVPVHIQISEMLPHLETSDWDHINRCELKCNTGRLVVAGCTDYFPDAERIEVGPGNFHVVIAYKNLNSVSEDGLDGDDSYHVFLARKT